MRDFEEYALRRAHTVAALLALLPGARVMYTTNDATLYVITMSQTTADTLIAYFTNLQEGAELKH